MSHFWHDALFMHMTWHIERGVPFDEAFLRSIRDIQVQLKGTSPKVAERLIEEAKRDIHYARDYTQRSN